MSRPTLYLISKFAALLMAAAYILPANGSITDFVILALVLSCLFVVDFLLTEFLKNRIPTVIVRLVIIGVCFYAGSAFCPLAVLSAAELADNGTEESVFWQITGVCTMLFLLLMQPEITILFTTLALLLCFAAIRYLREKLEALTNRSTEQSAELAAQRRKITSMKEYVKSVRTTAALEERSRFAARIHDQLGHGISGSIILLEGARFLIRTNPERAETAIDTAVENLRSGVDSIRTALHEERPNRAGLGMSELKTMLEQFTASYDIAADLQVSGDLEDVSALLWLCIKDNLTEAMTNLLKHSKATQFTLSISMYNRALRVEYKDNGPCSGSIKKGLGLEAIEDRTAANGGNTLFQNGVNGFSITTVFMNAAAGTQRNH